MKLEARNLARAVLADGREHVLVDDVSFDVSSGQVVALTGPSGSGKTQTLRLLMGLDESSDGEVRLGEEVIEPLLLPWFRKCVAAAMAPFASGSTPRAVFREAQRYRRGRRHPGLLEAPAPVGASSLEEAARDAGIAEALLDASWAAIGAPESLFAQLAVGAACGPPFHAIDETPWGLDREGRDRLARWMRGRAARGCGVIVATADERLIAQAAGHVVILFDGAVHAEGPPAQVIPGAVAALEGRAT